LEHFSFRNLQRLLDQNEEHAGSGGGGGGGGGATGPFSQTWPFDAGTDAVYTISDTTRIDLTGGVCRLTATDQIDNDDDCSGFGDGVTPACGGTFSSGLAFDEANTLDPSYSSHDVFRLNDTGFFLNTSTFDASWTPGYSSLIAYWNFDADWTDTIGANDATASGASRSTLTRIGSHASNFDGTDDYATLGTDASLNFAANAAFTIAGWFQTNDDYGPLITLRSSTDVNMIIGVYIGRSDASTTAYQIKANVGGGGASDAQISGTLVSHNLIGSTTNANWHHFALVRGANSETVELFLDGLSVGTNTNSNADGAITTDLRAMGTDLRWNADGGKTADELYYTGKMDDFAIWSTALTAAQIRIIQSRQSPVYSGTFVSRVMDAWDTDQTWTSLAWVQSLPFGKALPDAGCVAPCTHSNSETSTNYSALAGSTGALENPAVTTDDLMEGIQLLWHFDETAASGGSPDDFTDKSGAGINAEQAGGVTFGVPGKLNLAAKLDGTDDRITHAFQLPKAKGTLSHWLMPTFVSGAQDRVAYHESNLSSDGWTTNTEGSGHLEIDTGIQDGKWAASYQDDQITQDGALAFYDSGVTAHPGKWVHMVITWDRSSDFKIYLDGIEVFTINISGSTYGNGVADPLYTAIGRTGAGTATRFWHGLIDELAVWNRVLHPTEILQLYRRGANRVKHQVRVCTAADCTDDPTGANWKGPDNTRYSYFSEILNTSTYNTATNLPTGNVLKGLPSMLFSTFNTVLGTSRYFQYRTIFESEFDDDYEVCNYGGAAVWCSPELKSVTPGPTHYDPNSPTIIGETGVAYTTLATFAAAGVSCTSGITYNLGVGATYATATWYWWNGGIWLPANGTVAESNTATAISTNAPTFHAVAGTGTAYFKAFLNSSGSSSCEASGLQLDGTN
jgi:hypothetical protein